MPVPSSISDLSATPSLNSPAGTESPSTVDDYLRTHAAFIKQVDGGAVKAADLAATGGSALVGYDGGTAQDVFDGAKPVANYTALRAYTGRATGVRITQSGLAGFFQRDDTDTTSADNGGTIIVDASGRRWNRLFTGAVNVKWFGAVGNGSTNDTDAIQRSHNASYDVYYPSGGYLVSGKIQIRTGSRIQGASAGKTVVYLAGAMAGVEDSVYEVVVAAADFITQHGGIIIRDIFFNGNGYFGHGLLLRNIRFPIFDNVWIMNFNGAALLLDYVEEGDFNFLNINACGRTGGSANVSADTLYGQITFDKTAAVYAASNNNFLRFNNCTVANGNCSGDWFIKAASPSRIFINNCQSELSGGARFNRDWLHGNGQGGVFFLDACDVDGYRNVLNAAQYLEAYVSNARWGANTAAFSGENGTGSLSIVGSSISSISSTAATSLMRIIGTSFSDIVLDYPAGTTQISDCLGTSITTSNLGSGPVGLFSNIKLSGNLTTNGVWVNLPYVFLNVDVAGTLTIDSYSTSFIGGSVATYGNVNPDSRYEPRVFRVGSIDYGMAAPTAGYYKRGSIVYNTVPSASGAIGWVCVAEGAPGTWKTFGAIAA